MVDGNASSIVKSQLDWTIRSQKTLKNFSEREAMPKKINTLKYIEERKSNYKNFDYSKIPEEYSHKDKLTIVCKDCGNEFLINHTTLIGSQSKTIECKNRKCSSYRKDRIEKTSNFVVGLNAKNKDDFIFSKYLGYDRPIEYTCKKCGHKTLFKRAGLLKKVKTISCQFCNNVGGIKKNNEILDFQLKELFGGEITRVGDYVNDSTKIDFFCSECETIFNIAPGKLIQGRGCNNCTLSHGEKAINNYLRRRSIPYTREYKRDIYYYDFYLPDLKCLIEFDGEQHYKPVRFNGISKEKADKNFELNQLRDRVKNNLIKGDEVLLRISFKQRKHITYILEEFFKVLGSETIPKGSTLKANVSGNEETRKIIFEKI